ncbi:hypothetical protein JCM3765_003843 [Sporobolomyces pararoseus]
MPRIAQVEVEQTTLAVLCRTSKRFLATAQQLLYYSPLHNSVPTSWEPPLQLLESLSLDNKRLGRLVRSLEGLVDFEEELREFGDLPHDTPRIDRGDRNLASGTAWKIAMINACPGLDSIDLNLRGRTAFQQIKSALAQSASTISGIRFGGRDLYRPRSYVKPALVESLFDRVDFPNLKRIELGAFAEMAPPVEYPVMPRQITSVRNTQMLWLDYLNWIFPENPSNLQSVSLLLAEVTSDDYAIFFGLIPASIRAISLDCPRYLHVSDALKSYGCNDTFPRILPQYFTSLPQLKILTLRGFQGPSVFFLHVLATSSPLLRSLDFSNSFWTPSNSTDLTTTLRDRLNPFQDEEVVEALSRFKYLRRIEFGYLPSCLKEAYDGLKLSLKGIGIEMEWQVIGELDFASAPWEQATGDETH